MPGSRSQGSGHGAQESNVVPQVGIGIVVAFEPCRHLPDPPLDRGEQDLGDSIRHVPITIGRAHGFRGSGFRSHHRYNTTIYGFDDRYRGVHGERRVVVIHPDDLVLLHAQAGERADLVGVGEDGIARAAEDFRLVPFDMPRGSLAGCSPACISSSPRTAAVSRGCSAWNMRWCCARSNRCRAWPRSSRRPGAMPGRSARATRRTRPAKRCSRAWPMDVEPRS